jgi:hypothetical protein
MSSAARRIVLAIAATAVLIAPIVASGAASAASYDRTLYYRGSDVSFHVFGSAPGYPGNAHAIYLNVENDQDGMRIVGGWIWDFRCGPGETINGLGYGDEDESDCTMVRALNLGPHSVRLGQPRGNVQKASIAGTVELLDAFGNELRSEPLNLQLDAFGATSKTDAWVDASNQDFLRTFESQASVTGTFGSLVVTGAARQEVHGDIWRTVLFDRQAR